MSFSRHAKAASKAAFRASGDLVTFHRTATGVSTPVRGVPERDIEIIGNAGTVVNCAYAYHLRVEEVGEVSRGDMILEDASTVWEIAQVIVNDGYSVTVQVVPCAP
jgi:hypothetical protein